MHKASTSRHSRHPPCRASDRAVTSSRATRLPVQLLSCALVCALAGCPAEAGPDGDAMSAYLDRHGLGDVAASAADTVMVAGPVARRVAITVERATELPDLDSGPGETDPYVALDYEGQRHRTSVVEGELNPVWGDTFIFDVRPGGVLSVRLMDEDSMSSDEQIGTQSQVLPDLAVGETQTLTMTFRNGQGGTLLMSVTGMVRP